MASGSCIPITSRKPSLSAWLSLGLALFTALVLWKLRNIQQIADSLGIAYDVRAGKDMFNPHHLLFGPSVRIVYDLLHLVGLNVDAITSAQVHNIGWSVVGVVCFFFIALKLTSRYGFAVVAALSLLFAHTYWQFSTQSEVYVAATGPVLLMLARLLCCPDRRLQPATFVVVLFLLCLSICYHQLGVFLLVPLWAFYYMEHGKRGLRFMSLFTIASGALTLLLYIAVYVSKSNDVSITGFVHYCLEYAYLNPDWGTMAHFKKGDEWLKIFTNQTIAFLPEWRVQNMPVRLLAVAFIGLWGWNLAMTIRKAPNYIFRAFVLLWLGSFYLFLVWWTAGYEFFVLTIPPTLLLLLFMIFDITEWLKRFNRSESTIVQEGYYVFVPLMVLCLLVRLNVPSFIKYHRENDIGYLQAQRAKDLCGACKVVTNFNVMTNLAYHQHYLNAVESDGLYIAFYYGDSIPQKYQLKHDSCVLMEVWYLNPWYNSLGKTGFDLPNKWLYMFHSLFGVGDELDGKPLITRDFKIIPSDGVTGDYIMIGPGIRKSKDFSEFFTALDDSINAKGVKNQAAFKKWYLENIKLFGPPLNNK